MKTTETSSKKKNYNFTSIRVKGETKREVYKFLEKVNKAEDCGKVTFDVLVNFFLERMTKEDMRTLQMKATNWSYEERYLRKLWKKRKGQVTDDQWTKMLMLGELQDFFSSNTRFQVGINP